MHRVFENAATTDEIYMAIEAMTQDGVLDEKEAPACGSWSKRPSRIR